MLITDGGVRRGQEEQMKQEVSQKGRAAQTHVFTLGIGHGVNRPMLDAVASA